MDTPFIPNAENALDYFNKLNVANTTIALLRKQLASAELLSAANLGVLPILFTPTDSSVDALTTYNQMEPGAAKTQFYARNSARIWAAKEAATGTVE
jgi:hypothetical protein